MKEVSISSSLDKTEQPALFYAPPVSKPVPLLVALHTWSFDYRHGEKNYAIWCVKKGWALVYPNFRGPNNNPAACGSDLVVQDIVDAVEFAKKQTQIDTSRIYLAGTSGGGYAALLLAARHPEIWAAVSAWCPIEDLAAWHKHHSANGTVGKYAKDMEAACGGAPGAAPLVDEQYRVRSAAAWLSNAKSVPLDINAGIYDGHKGSVPVSHSLRAFNKVAHLQDHVPDDVIARVTTEAEVPAEWVYPKADPLYVRGRVLFRRESALARVTLFDGTHEMYPEAGLAWLSKQKKGQPPVWEINEVPDADILRESSLAMK